ncbi:MAG: hypothetical protein AB8G15_10900 [Saprospiraceae bacterium]
MQEKRYHTIFDAPQNYPSQEDFYAQGESPRILSFFLDFLQERADELSEVYLSLHLYNNIYLHEALKALAQRSVKIHLVTIPIEGYATGQARIIHDLISGEAANPVAQSSYSLARPIFGEFYKRPIGFFDLYLFPHLSIRDAEAMPFVRGQHPYSLQLKSILLLYKNGGGAVGLSSCNLAVRENLQEENLVFVENDWTLLKTSLRFFQQLLEHAIHIRDFDFKKRYTHLDMQVQAFSQQEYAFFTAPFYKNSSVQAENFLVANAKKATRRIYLVAPHISSYEYTVNGQFHSEYEAEDIEHYGFLRTVLEQAGAGVEVRCISQSFAGKEPTFPAPSNAPAFQVFYEILQATSNTHYAINARLNSRYLIIDDTVIVTTCNFTPEQFIYLDQVDIPSFAAAAEESYRGIFAELGQFLKIADTATVAAYVKNFEALWERPATVVVK